MSEKKKDITHLRQRLAHSDIIVDATHRFTSTLDSDEIRLALFEAVFQVVGAQQIALHLINEEGLESTICYPMEGLRVETAVLPPEATAFRICEEVEQVIWHRDDDEQAAPPISVEAIEQFDSYLALPLKGADKVVGAIEAFNLPEPQYAAQQATLLVEIAGPAGLAIYNGMLYQEAQHEITERKRIELEVRQQEGMLAKRAAQLETVSRVSTYTSTILEPDRLLQEVVNLTKDQFELYHVHIYLVNEAGDQLDLVVGAGDVGRQMVAQGRTIPLQQQQSLVAQVARSGQGLIENDVLNNPTFLPHPLLPNTRSEAAVPVILRGRVIGVLDVQSDRVDTFTEQDIQIQTMLAAHIAAALENARSYEQAVTSLVETEALLDITKETSHVLELASITDNVLDKVLTATNFDAGLITIVNPDTQKLEVKSHRLPEQFWNMLQENGLDGTLCDLVYRRRESVVVVDMTADAPVDVTGLISLGYKSYQGVPLESQGEVLGTLCLFSRQSLTSEKANTVFLQAVGRQIGIAIRNVTLLEQAQMALSEAQQSRQSVQEYLNMQHLLHELNIELFRIDNLDELYRSAVELAHTRLGFERVGMYLLNESNDLLLGTYGVDAEGNICDERGPEYAIDQKETIDTFVLNRTRLVVDEDVDLWYSGEVVGRGWHIGAAMWAEDSPIGVIFADNLLTGQPLKSYQAELLFAYARMVSNLIQRNRFETIITKRAAEMQAVAEVGTAAATILATDELLQEVVDLTKNDFDLYHAHIYLLNTETEMLVLASGAGAVGQQMVAEGRQIPLEQEQSLVARAARSRQGVIINDVQADPGFLPHPLLPDTRAEMAVPLIAGEQMLGVLDVQSDRLNYFSKEDISTFTTLGAQTAVALQNARLFTQSEEHAEELALINRIVTQMNTIQDVKASLQFLVGELGTATQAGSAVMNLINENGTAQEVVAAYLQEGMPDPVGTVMPLEGDPMMVQMMETRQTLAVDDVASAPFPPEIKEVILQSGFRSLYTIPMFVGRDLIGSATISVLQDGEPLTSEQIRLAETLVFQATSVVQNIRLYAQAEQRAEELAFVNRIVTEINALDTKTGLQFMAEELGGILQVPSMVIGLVDDAGTAIEIVAARQPAGAPSPVGITIPITEESMMKQALQTRQTAIVEDVANADNMLPQDREAALEFGLHSLYIIPMVVGQDLIGTVSLNVMEGGNLLTPSQLRLAETTVHQAATAVQNARLFTQSEERQTLLRSIIDATPDWIFVKDEEHRYRLANQGYADALHIASEDFIGKNDLELGFPEELVKGDPEKGIRGFWADDRLVMESGEMQVYPNDPATIDGEVHTFHTIKAPLRDADGQVRGVLAFARDITEREQAEEALRRNEAELSEALKIAKLAYWEYDVENDLFTFNDQFFALFHTTAEEHGGYQLSSAYYAQHFVHPDYRPDFSLRAEVEQALKSTDLHYSHSLEHGILYADGSVGYVLVNINIDRDEQGNVLRYYGANQDITERVQAEEALRRSEAELSEALKIAKLAYWEYDIENDLYLFNDQFFALLHTTAEEHGGYQMPGAYYAQHFIHPDDLPVVGAEIDQALSSPEQHHVISLEHRILYADGGIGYVSVNMNVDRDEDGNNLRVYGANQDITERKQAEEALRHSEANLSEAFKIAKLAYWELDIATLTFTFNDEIYDLLRTTAEQEGGYQMTVQDYAQRFVHPDDAPAVGRLTQQAIETSDPNFRAEAEARIIRADGTEGVVLVRFRIEKDAQGRTVKTFGANQDITERKRIEEALAKQARELQIVAELSTTVATTLEQEKLLQEVVDLTRERFEFYHAQIDLLNAQQDTLVLAFGAGDVGRKLVAQEHQIGLSASQSLVAQAARSGQAVVVNDVRENPNWLPNKLLPQTHAEMAVPMMVGDRVVGVLDVQSERVNHFTNQDMQIQTTLASQVSIAVENARSFEQAQTAVAEMNALTRRLTREGWQDYLNQAASAEVGYIFDGSRADLLNPISEATGEATLWMEDGNGSEPAKPLIQPIAIHGETIGQLAVMPEDDEDEVDSEIAEIIRSVIEQLGARIENLRLSDQTQIALAQTEEQAQRLGQLNEMSTTLSQTVSLNDIYQIAVDETLRIMAVDGTSLLLLTETKDHFEIVATSGEDSGLPRGVQVPIADTPMQQATQENRIVYSAIEGTFASSLYIPLVVGGDVIGALNLGYKEARVFKVSDEGLLRQIVTLVSSYIENTRFLLNEQARAQREQMLRQITQRIRSSSDVETIMRTAVQEIGRTLGRKTYIYLGDDREA